MSITSALVTFPCRVSPTIGDSRSRTACIGLSDLTAKKFYGSGVNGVDAGSAPEEVDGRPGLLPLESILLN